MATLAVGQGQKKEKNWFRTKIHWLIRNIFRQSYNKIRILKWWYQIWIVPWSTQQRKTLHVTHKTGFHRIDANNILSFLQFENITVWQLANSALLGTNRLNHTTINTFSDTERSEFVLFVIEKQDNQGQDGFIIHPRTRCWWPTIQN